MRKALRQDRPLSAGGFLTDKGLEPLFSEASLESLMEMLLSKDRIRKGIPKGPLGPRVIDLQEASRSLRRIMAVTEQILRPGLNQTGPGPHLEIDDRLGRLKSETIRSLLVFSALALCLTAVCTLAWPVRQVYFPVVGSGLSLLAIPFLIHRRTRIHLEHQCVYTTDKQGEWKIRMAQLPQIQFDSYLAHEFGHHLLRINSNLDPGVAPWRREGWARLFQWAVMSTMAKEANEPAYLFHALSQTLGELKFACEVICGVLKRPLPKRLRRVKTIFSTNPVFCLITGTPLTDINELAHHGLGTAFYFLTALREGVETALQRPFPVSCERFSPVNGENETPPSPTTAKPNRRGGVSDLISP
jgi:hypothetical protein